MELIELFINFSNDYFRPVLLLFTSCFALYFAYQKLTVHFSASYTVNTSIDVPTHISAVSVVNNKDRTFTIWSVYAVINGTHKLKLTTLPKPVVIKPYEALTFECDSFSKAYIGDKELDSNYFSKDVEIYLALGDREVKCKAKSVSKRNFPLENLEAIYTERYEFAGHLYDEHVAYILHYQLGKESKIAYIGFKGLIYHEWGIAPNGIRGEISEESLRQFLVQNGFHDMFDNYQCYQVDFPKTKFVFDKTTHNKQFKSDS
ncbi:hypothetical protein [Vibrio sp. S12_S33]|uniref:hypothetical protein n=1 Tax=Vibrio sp. S12_S33 TaxID=2720223 RepID=UPI0017859639|nr:hypothetical protein [Vibrio sp. S12_S33]MBD1567581.1 hypothetical protein [Vibrio sp. S12_S33]